MFSEDMIEDGTIIISIIISIIYYCYTSDRNVWLWLVQIASRTVS